MTELAVLHHLLMSFDRGHVENTALGSANNVALIVSELAAANDGLRLCVLEDGLGRISHIVEAESVVTGASCYLGAVSVPSCVVCLSNRFHS